MAVVTALKCPITLPLSFPQDGDDTPPPSPQDVKVTTLKHSEGVLYDSRQ